MIIINNLKKYWNLDDSLDYRFYIFKIFESRWRKFRKIYILYKIVYFIRDVVFFIMLLFILFGYIRKMVLCVVINFSDGYNWSNRYLINMISSDGIMVFWLYFIVYFLILLYDKLYNIK